MSDEPQPHPDAAPQPASRPRSGRTAVLWVLLLVACASVIGVDPVLSRFVPPPPPPDPATLPDQNAELMTRFLIGLRSVMPTFPPDQFIDELDKGLQDPASMPDRDDRIRAIAARIRVAIAVREGESSEEALARLDALAPAVESLDPPDPELARDLADARTVYTSGSDALDADARARLVDRYGNMGRVLISQGLDPASPERRDVVARATRAIIAIGAVMAIAAVGFLVGCVLAITAIVMRASGRLRPRFRPDLDSPPRRHDAYLEAVVIFIAALAAFKVVITLFSAWSPGSPVAMRVVVFGGYWAIALATFWPRVRGVSARDHSLNMGWIRGRGVVKEVLAGIAAYLAFLPVLAVGFVLVVTLSKWLGIKPTHPIVEDVPTAGPWELAVLFTLASVWAPLVEESIFRGALYHHLRRFGPGIMAAFVTAFLFAAIHPQGITTVPALMALALGFAACREWRGSLIGSMTTHALHNATLLTLNLVLFG